MTKTRKHVYLLKMRNAQSIDGDRVPTTPIDEATFRSAMLSVYYESLGHEFEISGAPSVLFTPQAQAEPLAVALEQLSAAPNRLLDALWLLVRGVHVRARGEASAEDYPAEMLPYVEAGSLAELVRIRRRFRAGANIFAAALVACRDGYWRQFQALCTALRSIPGRSPAGFSAVTSLLMGLSAVEYLDQVAQRQNWSRSQRQIRKLEAEVGLNIYDFVEQLADAAAFSVFAEAHIAPEAYSQANGLVVYPVSSVIRQDRKTLTTSATATTLVRGTPTILALAADPQAWAWSSDVIKEARFVHDPFSLEAKKSDPLLLGQGFSGARLLEERAVFSWGRRRDEASTFHNVLNVEHRVKDKDLGEQIIDVTFSLCRSINSAILWDRRVGGLQLNQGYMKVRPLGQNTWRVTWKKLLRFSDRSPNSNGQGISDFGQMLNYLAPAALTWWVESETYSMADVAYRKGALASTASGGSGRRDVEQLTG